jgi:DNA repair protein RAD57
MLRTNPILLAAKQRPALDKVISIVTPDLESQDHILRYQVPVAIKRHNIGLIVLDSVAANYRAEFERPGANKNGAHMAQRSAELVRLGQLLRDLARSEGIAIVVANQVSDRFERPDMIHVPSSDPNNAAFEPLMTLDHQQRWFTGWGDEPHFSCGSSVAQLKTPSLGLVWTTQIACRIALIKSPIYEDIGGNDGGNGEDTIARELILKGWRRYMKIVFAPWTAPSGEGVEGLVEFAIGSAGIAGLAKKS